MYAGIDIGGTNIKYGVVSQSGEIICIQSITTEAQLGKNAVILKLRNIIHALLQDYPELQSIGIGFPSVVNPKTGVVQEPPNMPGWGVIALRDLLQSACPVPIVIDNDANVAALAESELGSGKEHSHFLYVTLGTGIGGAIISDNQIYHGERGGAGEIGHVIINMFDEPTKEMIKAHREFRAGVLEIYTGREAIIHLALQLATEHPLSKLNEVLESELDVINISHAAHDGDEAALLCMQRVGKYLGLGIASALSLLDMRVVIIGGGISKSHPILLETIQSTLQTRTLHSIANEVRVLQAHFEENAGLVGAAMLGRNSL